jgi:hypothetical protein
LGPKRASAPMRTKISKVIKSLRLGALIRHS